MNSLTHSRLFVQKPTLVFLSALAARITVNAFTAILSAIAERNTNVGFSTNSREKHQCWFLYKQPREQRYWRQLPPSPPGMTQYSVLSTQYYTHCLTQLHKDTKPANKYITTGHWTFWNLWGDSKVLGQTCAGLTSTPKFVAKFCYFWGFRRSLLFM